MVRRKAKTECEKTIPEIADELARRTVRRMCKDGKLTPQGRSLAKLMDRIMPDEKVDEWGWNLSRKERPHAPLAVRGESEWRCPRWMACCAVM